MHTSYYQSIDYYSFIYFDEAVSKVQKREKMKSIFLFQTDVSVLSSLLLEGFERSVKGIQRDTPLCLLS